MAPWCGSYHYWRNSISKTLIQVLCRFKSCLGCQICDDENLWQWSRLQIKRKVFHRSNIPEKQFIIIIIIIIIISKGMFPALIQILKIVRIGFAQYLPEPWTNGKGTGFLWLFLILAWNHSFSKCAKLSEKQTFLNPNTCVYQGARNVSFFRIFWVRKKWMILIHILVL